ncbi:hypothetical protein A1F96_11273, partial [Pyrenophora tritici-repentis]
MADRYRMYGEAIREQIPTLIDILPKPPPQLHWRRNVKIDFLYCWPGRETFLACIEAMAVDSLTDWELWFDSSSHWAGNYDWSGGSGRIFEEIAWASHECAKFGDRISIVLQIEDGGPLG